MAITRVGGTSGGAVNAGAVTLTLPTGSMQVNDLIIVAYGNADNDATNPALAMTTAGYTNLLGSTLHGNNAGGDGSLAIFYRFWDGVQTTAVCAAGGTGTDSASAAALQVFRGVDTSTPFEVTSQTATGTSGGDPNPPSISGFTEATSAVVIAGCVASATSPLTLTAPTNYTTNAQNGTGTDTFSASTGLAYRLSGAADPEDPGVFADSGAGVGWAAVTMVLKAKLLTQAIDATTSLTLADPLTVLKPVSATSALTAALAAMKFVPKAIAATMTLTAALSRKTLHPIAASVAFVADLFMGLSTGVLLSRRVGKLIETGANVELFPAQQREHEPTVAGVWWLPNGADTTVTDDTAEKHSGSASLRVQNVTPGYNATYTADPYPVQLASYIFSIWLKRNTGTTGITLQLYQYNASFVNIGTLSVGVGTITSSWAQYSGTFTGIDPLTRYVRPAVAASSGINSWWQDDASFARAPTVLMSPTIAKLPGKLVAVTSAITAALNAVFQAGAHVTNQAIDAAVTLTVAIAKRTTKFVPATTTVTAALTKLITHAIAATTTLTAAVAKRITKFIAATVTLTAVIAKQITKFISATTTVTAVLAQRLVKLKAIDATTTVTVAMSRRVGKLVTATVTLIAALTKQLPKTIAASTTLTVVIAAAKRLVKAIAATVTLSVSIAKQITKFIPATTTITAAITQRLVKLMAIAATTTLTVARAIRTNKLVTVTTTLLVSLTKLLPQAIAATTSLTVALVKKTLKTIAALVTVTAAMTRVAVKTKIIDATTALTTAISRRTSKTIAATTALTAALAKRVLHIVDVTTTLTVALSRKTAHTIAALTTLSVSIAKRSPKLVAASVSVAAAVSRLLVKQVAIAATSALSVVIDHVKQTLRYQTISAATALSAAISRRTAHAIAAATSITAQLSKLPQKLVAAAAVIDVAISRFISFTIRVTTSVVAVLRSVSSKLAHGRDLSGPTSAQSESDATGAETTGADPWDADTGEGR